MIAANFYKTVFNIPFKSQPEAYAEEKGRFFDFTQNGVNLSGGILKVPDEIGILTPEAGGTTIFWFVEDVDKSAEVIVTAGGKMLTDKVEQGDSAFYRYFKDTEGVVGAVHMQLN